MQDRTSFQQRPSSSWDYHWKWTLKELRNVESKGLTDRTGVLLRGVHVSRVHREREKVTPCEATVKRWPSESLKSFLTGN